jgi:ketosteroid isomerase-like protein
MGTDLGLGHHQNIKMKNIIYFFALISILFFGCGDQLNQQGDLQDGDHNPTTTLRHSKYQIENQQWASYLNLMSDSLSHLYRESSVKILSNGEVISGNDQISKHLLSGSVELTSIASDTVITANDRRAIDYEISESVYSNGDRYKNLVIWQTENSLRQRVLEFTTKIDSSPHNSAEIDDRRALWIDLCNRHNAQALIQELYSENTLYFNHKPLVKGRELLVDEYQYMNNTEYQLSLQPEYVEKINTDFVFEIGQCSGSYNGKYLLIWKKDKDGAWRIFIDSNI